MYGQNTEIIPGQLFKPERLATNSEQAKWAQLLDKVDQCSDRLIACRLLGINAAAAKAFADKRGLSFPDPDAIETKLISVEDKLHQLIDLIRQVQDHELALQFRNNDIDIIDPNQKEMGAVLLIALGVVLVVGALSTAGYLYNDLQDAERELRIVHGATNKHFCSDPTSETCADWKQYKAESAYDERKTWADQITDFVKKPIAIGGKWGIAVAIPLIAFLLLWQKK